MYCIYLEFFSYSVPGNFDITNQSSKLKVMFSVIDSSCISCLNIDMLCSKVKSLKHLNYFSVS